VIKIYKEAFSATIFDISNISNYSIMLQLDIKKYTPVSSLVSYIDAYWSIKNISKNNVQIPIVPDGCMDIIYNKDKIIYIGAMSEAFVVTMSSSEYIFGIRFKPSILAQVLNIKASDYRDKKIDLKELSLELFQILNFKNKNELYMVNKLNGIFENVFLKLNFNPTILQAVELIKLYQGNIEISDLSKELKLSTRQTERLFQQLIGYSPKKFCNIIRFFSFFKELAKSNIRNYSLKAYDYGYYDQSHLNKEFKKFSNFTPSDVIMSIFYNTKK